jgi:predicted metal-dependent enzyme (double-stranded beta helix superfamily)
MTKNSLETFIEAAQAVWGPLNSALVASCHGQLEDLVKAAPTEEWLADLHRDTPASRELHRDPMHGFLLLAHAESSGRYRGPHDHGRGWVIYAVQRGEVEMGTYVRVEDAGGDVRLVKRDTEVMRPGAVKVFPPGDIHDTRSGTDPVMLFRFTDRDLVKEEKLEHRVTRYVDRDGVWTDPRHG